LMKGARNRPLFHDFNELNKKIEHFLLP